METGRQREREVKWIQVGRRRERTEEKEIQRISVCSRIQQLDILYCVLNTVRNTSSHPFKQKKNTIHSLLFPSSFYLQRVNIQVKRKLCAAFGFVQHINNDLYFFHSFIPSTFYLLFILEHFSFILSFFYLFCLLLSRCQHFFAIDLYFFFCNLAGNKTKFNQHSLCIFSN